MRRAPRHDEQDDPGDHEPDPDEAGRSDAVTEQVPAEQRHRDRPDGRPDRVDDPDPERPQRQPETGERGQVADHDERDERGPPVGPGDGAQGQRPGDLRADRQRQEQPRHRPPPSRTAFLPPGRKPRAQTGAVTVLRRVAHVLTALIAFAATTGPAGCSTADAGGATPPVPRIAGCALFPRTDPWRRDISTAPVSRHSRAWVHSIGASLHLHPDFGSNPSYGIPYEVVPADQKRVPIHFTAYGDQSDPGPYPVPRNARVEAGSDRHVLVASRNCHLYELYDARRARHGWDAASGAVFDLRSNRLRPNGWTSADAAGLPILPGLVRPDEVRSGHIDHALRFTVETTQRGYIHPATHEAGSTDSADAPPMGARFRFKASFSLKGYTGAARTILVCLKHYGMFVADNGGNWYISGATWRGWNDSVLDQLKRVPGSAFQAVATGRIRH